jgi:sec-independent protein translocase protein TatA
MLEGLFQPMHLLVIFFIALLVFGPKKLPELGKGLGEGIRALKDGMKDGMKENPPQTQASSEPSKTPETKA